MDGRVIQRSVQAVISLAVDLEVDVFEAEGLGLGFGVLGVEVLTRSEKPEETDDDEVGEVAFLGTIFGVLVVEDFGELKQDGGVDRVGPGLRGVLFPHSGGDSFE